MSKLHIDVIDCITKKFNKNYSDFDTFIETGTFCGETVLNVYNYFQTVHTIELSEVLFNRLKESNVSFIQNIIRYFGNSVEVMSDILGKINHNNKCIFWLDAHYSGGFANDVSGISVGSKDTPLIEECSIINQFYKSDEAIVLIDDYNLFGKLLDGEQVHDMTLEQFDIYKKQLSVSKPHLIERLQNWIEISDVNIVNCFSNFNLEIFKYEMQTGILCLYLTRKV